MPRPAWMKPTCVAVRYPTLRIGGHESTLCVPAVEKILCRSPISQRSHVGNLRQTLQGKGVIHKRVETVGVYPLVRPRGVSALPAEVQRKPPRPLGANTLTQFVRPAQPVQRKRLPPGRGEPACQADTQSNRSGFLTITLFFHLFQQLLHIIRADRTRPYADWCCSIWFPVPDCSTSPDSDRAAGWHAARRKAEQPVSGRVGRDMRLVNRRLMLKRVHDVAGALSGTPAASPFVERAFVLVDDARRAP